jgi:hypothetical protein
MKLLFVWSLFGSLVFWSSANADGVAENYSAETMMKLCTGSVPDENPDFQSMTCTFRLQGLTDVMIGNCASVAMGFQPSPALSASRPPSRGAVRQAFLNFMEDHPEHWGVPWAQAAAMAVSGSFPCEQG